MDYRFWDIEKYKSEDYNYLFGVIGIIIFHYNIFCMIISLFKVSTANPGNNTNLCEYSLLQGIEFQKWNDKK
jgi:hypothetical protein